MGKPVRGNAVPLHHGRSGIQGEALPKKYADCSAVTAKKIGRRNEYTPLVSEEEYQTAQTKTFLDKIYEGSAKGLVSNLIMGDLLTDVEYEELKKLLEKGREK